MQATSILQPWGPVQYVIPFAAFVAWLVFRAWFSYRVWKLIKFDFEEAGKLAYPRNRLEQWRIFVRLILHPWKLMREIYQPGSQPMEESRD